MKKLIALLMAAAMTLSLCACGGGKTSAPETDAPAKTVTLSLGETAQTDIVSVTLDWAELAIALENTWGDDYYNPKEYDPQDDAGNPYVAAKGHTLVAMTYTITNLDRASVDLDGSFNPQFISIAYHGETFSEDTYYGASGTADEFGIYDWKDYKSGNILLSAGETETYKCYIDIPVEAADLNDTFYVTFSLPTVSGETSDFVFEANSEGRTAAKEAMDAAAAAAQAAADAALAEALSEIDSETSNAIKQILQGEWEYQDGVIGYNLLFNQDSITVTTTIGGAEGLSNTGSYSVRRDYILIEYDNGGRAGLPYTYENGQLNINYLVGLD